MARDIDLTSQAWCDLVFEGKNKKYGAYYLRKTSSRRHIKALIIVAVLGFVGVLLPTLIKTVMPEKQADEMEIGPVELSALQKQEVPEENKVEEFQAPPPPILNASIKFTPPVVRRDEEVADQEIITQEELTESKATISVATVEGVTDGTGVDISTLIDNKVVVQEEKKEEIFSHVEQMPEFPGGQTELMKYLYDRIKYPVIAQEQGIQGTVVLRFVVGKDGSVSDVQVQRSLDPSCDKEAVRVVKSMPKWVPGKQNGRPVLVYFTLPVRFKLAN